MKAGLKSILDASAFSNKHPILRRFSDCEENFEILKLKNAKKIAHLATQVTCGETHICKTESKTVKNAHQSIVFHGPYTMGLWGGGAKCPSGSANVRLYHSPSPSITLATCLSTA